MAYARPALRRFGACAAALAILLAAAVCEAGSYKVYSTYLWHLQQPIYWPEKANGLDRYQFAYESMSGSANYPGHPQNNLADIFGLDDREAAYQYRTRDSVSTILGQPDAGAQISYAGSLIENVWSLGDHYSLAYTPTWYSAIREAAGWTTSRARRRLEPVGFSYHHAFMPLLDPDARVKEVAINKHIWWKAWGGNMDLSDHPRGFRCSEEGFSERIIKDLVEAGYEWVIVPNHHLSRTHPNYVRLNGKGVYDAPNRADQNNAPNSGGWYSGEIDGRGSTESIPFSFQPHRAKYVDPTNGAEYKIIVVPMTDLGSYRDGYSQQGIDILHMLNGYATYDRPCIALFSHDGDNAWGGGYSYYQDAVPSFVGAAAGAGYRPTTIQTFLDENPPPSGDVVHVEDGAWMNAENDWGHPMFINWLWPPQRDRNSPAYNYLDPATYADITNGWAEDFRNWAVIMGAQNYVSTAEQIHEKYGGVVDDWRIQEPVQRNGTSNSPDHAELAWHYFLASLDSGYMYYGASIDMEVKPSLACNQAVYHAQKIFDQRGLGTNDETAPTVFNPQRYPWNPGSTNYSALTGYKTWVAPHDFHVWTLAYDVSGITSMLLKVRTDLDGYNPVENNDNETYGGGLTVGPWQSFTMNKRAGSGIVSNIFNDPNINFFIMPTNPAGQYYIADEYWTYLTGFNNALLDYYVEAYDARGNVKRTDIQHVFVGSEGGGTPVTFSPSAPRDCDTLNTTYNSAGRPLSNANPVSITLVYTGSGTVTNYNVMTQIVTGVWSYPDAVPAGSTGVTVKFAGVVGFPPPEDDNGGVGWSVAIAACAASNAPSAVGFTPAQPNNCDPVVITYSPNGGPLKDAASVYLHVGRNGWQDVPSPDPAMAKAGTNWVYTNTVLAGTVQLDAVFNNGEGLWDNNGGQDWHVAVSNCPNPVTFSPTNLEDCGTVTIAYDASNTMLSAADPVHAVITFSGHFHLTTNREMSGAVGEVWRVTNAIGGGTLQVSVYFQNADGTIKDGEANPWTIPVWACSSSPVPSSVVFTPTNPNGCSPVVIGYTPGNGPLANAATVYLHVGRNGWKDVITPDPPMAWTGTNWVYTNALLAGTIQINCAFNDGASTWDNNYGLDWAVRVENCGGVTQQISFAEGTPLILDSTGSVNRAGEGFHFDQSGGDAVTVDQGGFGSFGHVYVNYDASNVYIGGIECNMSGSNNCMVVFLAVNTLGDNADNLWSIDGPPAGLDQMHNLAFVPPVDIAIVLGDQWGDRTEAGFQRGGPSGYPFGQGVYYLSAVSHTFETVAAARVSQFWGSGTNALTQDADPEGGQDMKRWVCSIPLSSLGAADINALTCHVSGVLANDLTNGVDRYLSSNYLGLTATNNAPRDAVNNFAFTFVTLTGLEVGKPNADSDGDGLLDDWELRYFGGKTNATWYDDDDDDTFNNDEEQRLGTHPLSSASALVVTNLVKIGPYARVTWQTVGGKSYAIEYSDNLLEVPGPFQQAKTVAETDVDDGVGSSETFEDDYFFTGAPPANGFRSYRIRLGP